MFKIRMVRAIIGIGLIFTGVTLVLSNLGLIDSADFLWYLLFLFMGTYLYYIGYRKQVVFEGFLASFLFPIGVIGLLFEFQILKFGISVLWPMCLIFFSLYLIYIYSFTRSKLYLFILSMFMFCGTIIQLRLLGLIGFSIRENLLRIWPLVLVLIGLYMLRGIIQHKEKTHFLS